MASGEVVWKQDAAKGEVEFGIRFTDSATFP